MSLKSIITNYVASNYPRAVHKGEIGRKAVLEWGYENENSGRRCRELENDGILERVENEKGEVMYRYVPPELRKVEAKESPPKEMKKFWQRVNQETKPVQFAEPFKKVVITNQQLF